MSVHASATVAVGIVAAAFLLGSVFAWTPVRRMRTELARIRHLAEHDPLTGLPNRSAAQRHFRLQAAAERACTAVLVDLDGFKAVNDTWGHHAGDAQLTAVAERLTAACRPIGGFAARLAGDEFLLLLPTADSATVLRQVTTLLARLGTPLTLPVDDTATIICKPAASAGIALAQADTAWSDLLRHADIALYQAKTRRGRATLYTPGMSQPAPATPPSRPAHLSVSFLTNDAARMKTSYLDEKVGYRVDASAAVSACSQNVGLGRIRVGRPAARLWDELGV